MIEEMMWGMVQEMMLGMILETARAVDLGGPQRGSQAELVVLPQERARAAQDLKQGQQVRQGQLQEPAQALWQGPMQRLGWALLQEGVQSWVGAQIGVGC